MSHHLSTSADGQTHLTIESGTPNETTFSTHQVDLENFFNSGRLGSYLQQLRRQGNFNLRQVSQATGVSWVVTGRLEASGVLVAHLFADGEHSRTVQAPLANMPPTDADPGYGEIVRNLIVDDGSSPLTTADTPETSSWPGTHTNWWIWATVGAGAIGVSTAVLSTIREPDMTATVEEDSYTLTVRLAD